MLGLRRTLILWSVGAASLSVLGLAALIAAMMGGSITEIDWAASQSILFETPIGTAWLVRMAALSIVLIVAMSLRLSSGQRLLIITFAGTIALSSLVWTGHAGATEGSLGLIHKLSDILHMIAAAIWLGGIAAFLLLLRGPMDRLWSDRLKIAHRALDDFSRIGTICVTVIVVTGLVNGQFLVGLSNIWSLLDTGYGQLLLLKLALVAVMLGLASRNRWRLAPDLGARLTDGDVSDSAAALQSSLLLEAAAALVILGLVAWLGMLGPPASLAMS